MKKMFFLLVGIFITLSSYSVPNYTSKVYRDSVTKAYYEYRHKMFLLQKERNDSIDKILVRNIDSTNCHIDTCKRLAKEITDLLKVEVKKYGLIKTIQINKNLFIPLVTFLILYLVWLKHRKEK